MEMRPTVTWTAIRPSVILLSPTQERQMTTSKLTLHRIKGEWPRVYRNGEPTGYYINEGSFSGTTDDRLGRWYVQHEKDQFSRKFGAGHRPQADAIDAVRELIELEALDLP